jgi:hypothetical protein
MIVVKPTIINFFLQSFFEKFANSFKTYLNSDNGNIYNQDHINVLLIDFVRTIRGVELDHIDIQPSYKVELEDGGTGFSIFGKNNIDILVEKNNTKILLQTIISNDNNFDINFFILECLKLSLEDMDFKHIILYCNNSIANSFIYNNRDKKYSIKDFADTFDFKIVDNINKNIFEIILKDGPIEITPSFVLLHFQVD